MYTHEYIYCQVYVNRDRPQAGRARPWVRGRRFGRPGRDGGTLMPRGDFDRSVRKAQTRASLLSAAARVYARAGFGGATLDEVAAEAGFTKGAVYSHFGSKENLLLALMEEHLASQVAEQVELFDPGLMTWERPLAGSARWMDELREDPDPFRLFVELWSYAQRDERLRGRLAGGLVALRATFARFALASAADAGVETPAYAGEQFATVMIALGLGLSMVKLIDPERVPPSLLGAVISVLIRAAETSREARELLADPDGAWSSAGPVR
jgi:AcrR family transcriptional regulator